MLRVNITLRISNLITDVIFTMKCQTICSYLIYPFVKDDRRVFLRQNDTTKHEHFFRCFLRNSPEEEFRFGLLFVGQGHLTCF